MSLYTVKWEKFPSVENLCKFTISKVTNSLFTAWEMGILDASSCCVWVREAKVMIREVYTWIILPAQEPVECGEKTWFLWFERPEFLFPEIPVSSVPKGVSLETVIQSFGTIFLFVKWKGNQYFIECELFPKHCMYAFNKYNLI